MNADSGAPCSPRHCKKKQFIDGVKRAVGPHSTSKQQTEAAAVTCVKLCKASTYINIQDSSNVAFILVQSVINDLKVCGGNATGRILLFQSGPRRRLQQKFYLNPTGLFWPPGIP